MNQAGRVTTPTGNQKIVFVTQRSQPQGNIHQSQPSVQPQQNTVVKIMSNANTQNQQQKVVGTPQKLVVVCMPSTGTTNSAVINTQGQTTVPQSSTSQTTNLLSPGLNQNSSQPPFSVVPKPNFIQQTQKVKQDNTQPPSVDDLSHLA